MTAPTVHGLDLSLTCPGIAGITPNGQPWADSLRTEPLRGHHRIQRIMNWLRDFQADLWVIEGLAFDAHDTDRGNAGLNWMVRHWLWLADQPYALIPATTLKAYACGKGTASKEDMLLAADRQFPTAAVANNNEADAMWLAHAGAEHLGRPTVRLPAPQRAVLDKMTKPGKGKPARPVIIWPDLAALQQVPA
jgi:Holliday junction resolvasome RuvABC endonuclease subunit